MPQNVNRLVILGIILFLILGWLVWQGSPIRGETAINYTTFLRYLRSNKIISSDDDPLVISEGKIRGKYRGSDGNSVVFTTNIPRLWDDGAVFKELDERNIKFKDEGDKSPFFQLFLFNVLPILILIFMVWFMFKQFQGSGNKAFTFGKSKARKFEPKEKVTFKDVAGVEEAKQELVEVVDFLKNPLKFTKIGAKIPKGALLVGPPGTGKTLLARATAGEAGVNFFYMSGSDFVEMFVGVGASRVRDLFEQGRKNAPCILFIDELDAVGRTRGAGYGGGHDEREQTLNQLLVEMDGFDPAIGVILLAATNRPDVLDPALLRPGRFDRQIVVDKPDVKGREMIFRIHTEKIKLSKNVDINKLAKATPGFSGADIANMVNEAALYAARINKSKVTMDEFEESRDKVMMGVARKSRIIPPEVKNITAYHEAGHAIASIFLDHTDVLHKVTVIPRGMALGVTFHLPDDEKLLNKSKVEILDEICMAMGGRAAEEIIFKRFDTGAASDINHATEYARKMVTQWGMSDVLGPVRYGQKDEPIFIGKELAQHHEYSEKTAQTIDEEIKKIISEQYQRAYKILSDNKDKLIKLSEALYEDETLDAEQIYELLEMRPKKLGERIVDGKNQVKKKSDKKEKSNLDNLEVNIANATEENKEEEN